MGFIHSLGILQLILLGLGVLMILIGLIGQGSEVTGLGIVVIVLVLLTSRIGGRKTQKFGYSGRAQHKTITYIDHNQ